MCLALNKAEKDSNPCGQPVGIGVPYASTFHIPIAGTCVTRVVYPDHTLPRLTRPAQERAATAIFTRQPVCEPQFCAGDFQLINAGGTCQ